MNGSASDPVDMRERILMAAAILVAEQGPDGLTTRAIAAAAGTQGPTIYRLFGDKRSLLDALAERAMAAYVADQHEPTADTDIDPVDALRLAWDAHIAFGLAHPALYHLTSAAMRGGEPSPAAIAGIEVLRARVRRIALAGRLKIAEERAVALIHAAGTGTITVLLERAPAERDDGLASVARDAVMTAIIADARSRDDDELPRLATTLRAQIKGIMHLSPGERLLLDELLTRLGRPSAA